LTTIGTKTKYKINGCNGGRWHSQCQR